MVFQQTADGIERPTDHPDTATSHSKTMVDPPKLNDVVESFLLSGTNKRKRCSSRSASTRAFKRTADRMLKLKTGQDTALSHSKTMVDARK